MILGLFLLACVSCVASNDTLVFTAVLFRHGDRTPVDPYPTDPYRNESLWPVKFGQLTNIGKQQHFKLGKWLKQRHSNLLSEKYDPTEIKVYSTDVDRTLMSAMSNLAGMYPPVGSQVWNEDLLWQPIPIHTMHQKDDEVLAMSKTCPAYNKALKKFITSEEFQEGLTKYQKLMDYLSAYTGMRVHDYTSVEYIYNTLYIESLYNFTLPEWTSTVYPHKMLQPAGISFTVPTGTPQLARLKVGPFLKNVHSAMLDAIAARSRNSTSYLKMVVFSAHDDTVAAVLNSLGMFNFMCPPYTATVLMELHYIKNEYNIKILYRNSTEIVEPVEMKIPYCGTVCPLTRYAELYSSFLNMNWERECQKIHCFSDYLGLIVYLGAGINMFLIIIYAYYARKARALRASLMYTELALSARQDAKIAK